MTGAGVEGDRGTTGLDETPALLAESESSELVEGKSGVVAGASPTTDACVWPLAARAFGARAGSAPWAICQARPPPIAIVIAQPRAATRIVSLEVEGRGRR